MAASLNISGRQLRRDRAAAYEALASILQDRYLPLEPPAPPPSEEPLRSESERLAQQKEPVDLSELIEGLIPLLQPLARQQEIHLISHLEPELPKPWVNRILIRQSLIGLASHALASLPLAQLAFEAHRVEGEIRLGLRLRYRRSADVVLPPPSKGGTRGVEAPLLEPLLKSVETLVSALNSQLCQEQVGPEEAAIWLLLPEGVERLVLVVDDNEELFALFQRYVTGQPYRLIHAASVDEALVLLPSARPDMIILDLMLPNRDGWELLQILHSNADTAQIPVAVCSILDDPELAFSWGAQLYLKKPVGSLELLQALAEALH
jgi:CheY-like chemotaxis protein